MNLNLLEKIKKFGLSHNEAAVYLALLELGQSSVTKISSEAGLNRTTSYDILENLCQFGLVYRVKAGQKTYIAEPPAVLKNFLNNKRRTIEKNLNELEDILPDLNAIHKTELKPTIKFVKGEEAMKKMYYHVLEAKSPIYSVLNLKNYGEDFGEMGEDQSNQRYRKGIKENVIAIESDTALYWWDRIYKGKKKRQENTTYRWLKSEEGKDTSGEILIFDDKVIGVLPKDNEKVAYEIQSENFANFLKIIFKLAWKQMTDKSERKD
jgi:sugar-specific transcriptional regulator TrmB